MRATFPLFSIAALLFAATASHAPASAQSSDPPRIAWVWGSNTSGQLGRPIANAFMPQPLESLPDLVAISGGIQHTIALRDDGSVWTWGNNDFGQLGTGDLAASLIPRRIEALTGITAVSAGAFFSLALRASDGRLWAWGDNLHGQLGLTTEREIVEQPSEIALPFVPVRIRAGGEHTVALDAEGKLWAWGSNFYGQLADPDTALSRSDPVQVPVSGVSSFCTGWQHNLAVTSSGEVWGWGWNSFGMLGSGIVNGWTEPVQIPVRAVGLPRMRKVECGQLHSVALSEAGNVWTWGYASQIGDGGTAGTGRHEPVPIALSNIVDIAGGGTHSLALGEDGSLWAWGQNNYGAIGTGGTDSAYVPVALARMPGLTAIAAGAQHSLVLAGAPGTLHVRASGANDHAQLGDGSTADRLSPVTASLPPGVLSVAAGADHALALGTDHRVHAWGSNESGQLGLAGGDRSMPTEVPIPVEPGQGIAAIAAGRHHSVALRSDGSVWVWGSNTHGQLGDGGGVNRHEPARIPGLDAMSAIAAGGTHTLALNPDGKVWGWGRRSCFKRAEPLSAEELAPQQVRSLVNVLAIAAGGCHSLALQAGGSVLAWGDNGSGQLGVSASSPATSAVRVLGLDGVVAIAAGTRHSLAVGRQGALFAWGEGADGQLGLGSSVSTGMPAAVPAPGPFDLIAAGESHSAAVARDGVIWTFGSGRQGQLATGNESDAYGPRRSLLPAARAVTAGSSTTLTASE